VNPLPVEEPPARFGGAYNSAFQPNPDYPGVRKAGNILGSVAPAIVAPALFTGGLPALPGALIDTAATTGATYAGGQGGRLVDQSLGGSGDNGEFFGSLAGSFVSPGAANLSSRLTTDANSLLRLRNAKLAGVEKPDLSLVGSDWAARRGSPATQEIQQAQIDASLRAAADAKRGAPAPGPISKGDVGQGVVDLSKQSVGSARTAADTVYRSGLGDRIDQNSPIPPEALTPLSANAEPAFQQPLIDAQQRAIDASRSKDAATAPRLLDPNAQAGLEADVTLRQNELNRLTQARADPAKIKSAEADLASAKGNLDANYGTTFNDVKVRRGQVRQGLDTGEGDAYILGQIHDAQTEAMRNAAMQRGVTSEEFDAVNQSYATLKERQAELEKIASAKEGQAYGKVFSPTNEQNVSTLQSFQQHGDSSSLGNLLANNFELKARGGPAAGRPQLPPDVGLNQNAPDWWANLPEPVREAYFPAGSPERAKVDATMSTIRGDARRGGGQIEPPDVAGSLSAGALALGHPGAAIAGMTPRVGSYLFGKLMQNPRFTETMIERRAHPLQYKDLARTLAAAVGSQQQ
jgi:hypothetical protein